MPLFFIVHSVHTHANVTQIHSNFFRMHVSIQTHTYIQRPEQSRYSYYQERKIKSYFNWNLKFQWSHNFKIKIPHAKLRPWPVSHMRWLNKNGPVFGNWSTSNILSFFPFLFFIRCGFMFSCFVFRIFNVVFS